MVRTGKKCGSALFEKPVVLLVFVAVLVLLLGFSTVVQAADKDAKGSSKTKKQALLDPFTLTLTSYSVYATADGGSDKGPNPHANERAKIMVPYRGWKRCPVKPPWPPE